MAGFGVAQIAASPHWKVLALVGPSNIIFGITITMLRSVAYPPASFGSIGIRKLMLDSHCESISNMSKAFMQNCRVGIDAIENDI